MEDKIGAILNNPQMMAQIMSMAQAMGGQSQEPPTVPQKPPQTAAGGEPDLSVLKNISSMAGQASIDKDQQALLRALSPFLPKDRLGKLERAMRAAKMAKFASSALGQNGLHSLLGR